MKKPVPKRQHTTTAGRSFPVLVPRDLRDRMRRGDTRDPIFIQVARRSDESRRSDGFSADPVGDLESCVAPGLLHKYRSRVLLVATGACAVHCRYCFRRSYPFGRSSAMPRNLERIWAYVAAHTAIDEIILSGGDPLILTAQALGRMLAPASAIAHVRTIRIHTRVPIADPQRVSAAHLALLRRLRKRFSVVVVVHANCAQELEGACVDTLARIVSSGVLLLNQAVLLRGVNDSADAQERLCRRLFECGVLPYYLHQLDRAVGTAHFEVPVREGKRIVRQLRERLAGYLVPRYVREVQGEKSKKIIV